MCGAGCLECVAWSGVCEMECERFDTYARDWGKEGEYHVCLTHNQPHWPHRATPHHTNHTSEVVHLTESIEGQQEVGGGKLGGLVVVLESLLWVWRCWCGFCCCYE